MMRLQNQMGASGIKLLILLQGDASERPAG